MTGVRLKADGNSDFRRMRDGLLRKLFKRAKVQTAEIESLSIHDIANLKIVIVIPAHNEASSIANVVKQALTYTELVIVVDDGSTDSTAKIAKHKGAIVQRHEKNKGKAAALNTGFQKARGFSPDAVVAIDADGQHLPGDIFKVLAPIVRDKADMVVGSRYLQNTSNVSLSRKWGHRALKLITRFLSGIAVDDSQCGYRSFSPKALNVMHFRSDGFSVESEMQFLAGKHCLRVKDVSITIQYPHKPKRSAEKQGLSVLLGDLKLTMHYRPLLFFGLPGLILFGTGVICYTQITAVMDIGINISIGSAFFYRLLCDTGMVLMAIGYVHNLINHLHASLLWAEGIADIFGGFSIGDFLCGSTPRVGNDSYPGEYTSQHHHCKF